MRRLLPITGLALVLAAGVAAGARAQVVIDNSKGVDPRVDYRQLDRFGPWDDRNYALTREDLALLADNEHELGEAIPAFYRVALRREHPELQRTGTAQYPRSALPRFLGLYRGYLVDDAYYRGVTKAGGRFIVLIENQLSDDDGADVGRFLSGEVRVTSPNGAAESAVAIHPSDPDLVIAGSNGPGGGQKMHYSTDGGETWTESAALPGTGSTCCDPTVDWSSDGTFAYAATLRGGGGSGGVWFYRSSDDGQTWDDLESVTPGDPRRELGTSGSDKEYLHVDRFATSPHKDNLYLTWHQGNVMQFARSTDSGNTWSTQSFSSDPLGIGSDITTDKDGNVYYFWPGTGTQQILVRKSPDGGVTFNGRVEVDTTQASYEFPLPSMETRRAWVHVAAAADLTDGTYANSVYVAWTDNTGPDDPNNIPENNHGRIQVAYSRDGGLSWTTVTPHETADANTVDRYNAWLAVAPDGSVHVVFYDTREDLPNRDDVDLFHSFSTDGGQTYSTPERLTTVTSPNISDGFEWGDYNGLDIVMNNLIAIYTDNRVEGGGGGDSVDVYAIGDATGAGEADLAIAKVDGVAAVDPGGTTTYTITASNNGPDAVTGASVTDFFPATLDCDWTCAPTGGATCTAGPATGHILDTVDLPSGDTAVYTAVCDVSPFATGTISNTATISGGPFDPTPGNDSATDVDTVNPPPACTLPDDDLTFDNDTVDNTEVHEACNSITAGPAYDVSGTGDLTFAVRGFIVLLDGFTVDENGIFVAINDPLLNP